MRRVRAVERSKSAHLYISTSPPLLQLRLRAIKVPARRETNIPCINQRYLDDTRLVAAIVPRGVIPDFPLQKPVSHVVEIAGSSNYDSNGDFIAAVLCCAVLCAGLKIRNRVG